MLSPLSLSQPLQTVLLSLCRLLDFGLQLLLLAHNFLLLERDLLGPLYHLNLHLLILNALLGLGNLMIEAGRQSELVL